MDRGVNESTQPSDLRAKAIGKSRMMLTTAVSNLTCSWSLRLRFKRQHSKLLLSFLFSLFLFCCTFPVGLALCWHQRLGITCLGGPWKCFLTIILQRVASAFLHLHWGSLSQCIFPPWCLTALYQLPACRGAAGWAWHRTTAAWGQSLRVGSFSEDRCRWENFMADQDFLSEERGDLSWGVSPFRSCRTWQPEEPFPACLSVLLAAQVCARWIAEPLGGFYGVQTGNNSLRKQSLC